MAKRYEPNAVLWAFHTIRSFSLKLITNISPCYFVLVTATNVYVMTDDGGYRTLRRRLRTNLTITSCHEIPEVRRLARNASAHAWRYTLGMPAVPHDTTSASRILLEANIFCHFRSPFAEVMSPVISWDWLWLKQAATYSDCNFAKRCLTCRICSLYQAQLWI